MNKKKQVTRTSSFWWAMLVVLLATLAQVVMFYVRFGFFNTQGSFANYVFFFLAGTLGGWILTYFLNRQGSARVRWTVLIAFLLVSPLSLFMMHGGGLFDPAGCVDRSPAPLDAFYVDWIVGKQADCARLSYSPCL